MTYHLLLADDHALFRDGVINALGTHMGVKVTATGDMDSVIDCLNNGGSYDLILLDLYMPGIDGLHTIAKFLKNYPDQTVAILSGQAYESDVVALRDLGLHGFFAKDMNLHQLAKGIELVLSGQRFFPTDHHNPPTPTDGSLPVDQSNKHSNPIDELTDREREVAAHLLHGLSNRAIGRKLNIASSTVKMHVRHICQKLSADNRTDAARILLRSGFG
jgi:DNA-binding NarL/FixJ family response regulator